MLFGNYDLLDKLTAYRVRPAPHDPPGKFETGTGNYEGMCGVLGALEYFEWMGESFGAEHAERASGEYSGRRLKSAFANIGPSLNLHCHTHYVRAGSD